ncbi:MAG: thioredoxin domain-containing protein [Gordonia sp. (in: high G+C Gram-positive bacteria)]
MADKRRKPVIDPRAAERRRSLYLKIGSAVAIVVVAAIVFVAVLWGNGKIFSDDDSSNLTTPSVLTGNAFRVTAAPAGTTPPAVLTLVEDFQCPACRSFEQLFGDAITELQSNPKVAVDYRPISILDRMSSTNYSTRAANASACVAEATGGADNFDVWRKFHNLLYANQPDEGGAGLANSQLIAYAREAGADNVAQCVNDGQFTGWVAHTTRDANPEHTPTVLINGTEFQITNQTTPQKLIDAVLAAAGGQQ